MSTRFYDTMTGLAPHHWWRFHEADAAFEDDIGVASIPASFSGSSGSVTSQAAGPLSVDQTSYSVYFADEAARLIRTIDWGSNDFDGTSDGSIVFFFKTATSGVYRGILVAHAVNRLFAVEINTSGSMRLSFTQGSNFRSQNTTPTGYHDNAWHMFAATCDGVNPNRLYIDGAEVAQTASTSGTGLHDHYWLNVLSGLHTPDFWLADDSYTVPSDTIPGFDGYISELAFFSYPLSATEVYSLWEASQPVPTITPGAGGHRYKGRRTFAGF